MPRPIVVSYPVQVAERLRPAAAHLPAEQIQAAPDCGLVPLSPPLARAKLGVHSRPATRAGARTAQGLSSAKVGAGRFLPRSTSTDTLP